MRIKYIETNIPEEEVLDISLDTISKTAFKIEKSGGIDPEMEKFVEKFLEEKADTKQNAYFIKSAMGAGEYWGPNLNADFFEEKELKNTYKSFEKGHVFENHANKDVTKSIGEIIFSVFNDKMKRVELFVSVDRKKGKKYIEDADSGKLCPVSMGVKIKYDVCSICGKEVKNSIGYCDHISREKNKIDPETGKKTYMINKGCNFFEISFVKIPADTVGKTLVKVASVDVTPKKAEIEKKVESNFEKNTLVKFDDILSGVAAGKKNGKIYSKVEDELEKGNIKKAYLIYQYLKSR